MAYGMSGGFAWDPSRSRLFWLGSPVLLVPAKAFLNTVKSLDGYDLLYTVAKSHGYKIASKAIRSGALGIIPADQTALYSKLIEVTSGLGVGWVEVAEQSKEKMIVNLADSLFAHLAGGTGKPECHLFSGLIAGFSEAVYKNPYRSREIGCVSNRNTLCVFSILKDTESPTPEPITSPVLQIRASPIKLSEVDRSILTSEEGWYFWYDVPCFLINARIFVSIFNILEKRHGHETVLETLQKKFFEEVLPDIQKTVKSPRIALGYKPHPRDVLDKIISNTRFLGFGTPKLSRYKEVSQEGTIIQDHSIIPEISPQKSKVPLCDFPKFLYAIIATACHKTKYKAIETMCMARNESSCEFQIIRENTS
ncbi:MAG: V4R domain-containing protein [Candidatus Wukongarchaeota archaeon]|nr:V4R domain-containing protein [Candidatus Wukongarchaeota archaeon]